MSELGFVIEDRGGIKIIVYDKHGCGPASNCEVKLWDAIASIKKERDNFQTQAGARKRECFELKSSLASVTRERDELKEAVEWAMTSVHDLDVTDWRFDNTGRREQFKAELRRRATEGK